jgi:hypothetical protein
MDRFDMQHAYVNVRGTESRVVVCCHVLREAAGRLSASVNWPEDICV